MPTKTPRRKRSVSSIAKSGQPAAAIRARKKKRGGRASRAQKSDYLVVRG